MIRLRITHPTRRTMLSRLKMSSRSRKSTRLNATPRPPAMSVKTKKKTSAIDASPPRQLNRPSLVGAAAVVAAVVAEAGAGVLARVKIARRNRTRPNRGRRNLVRPNRASLRRRSLPVERTGSADRHLISDEPVAPQPVVGPRRIVTWTRFPTTTTIGERRGRRRDLSAATPDKMPAVRHPVAEHVLGRRKQNARVIQSRGRFY